MELSSRDVEDRKFGSSVRGYDRHDVDGFLHDVARAMGTLEEHLAIAERHAGESERTMTEMRTHVDRDLQEATEARRTIIEEAKVEAQAIRDNSNASRTPGVMQDAAVSADAIIAQAEAVAGIRLQEVATIVEGARVRAEQTLKIAEQDASATRAEATAALENARRSAKEVRSQAETDRSQVISEISDLKRIADAARSGSDDLEAFETANVILTSGLEITIDLRDEVPQSKQTNSTDVLPVP